MVNRRASDEETVRNEELTDRPSVVGRPTILCHVTFIVLGSLLLAAAAFKTYEAYSAPMSTWSVAKTLALICFELCFGTWLAVGARTKWTWRASVACFAMFACVSAYKVLTGASYCGCFGTLEVNPSITLGIDVAALTLLILCRTGIEAMSDTTIRNVFLRVISIALTLSVLATAVLMLGHYRCVSANVVKRWD
jgi:hypothetical protein